MRILYGLFIIGCIITTGFTCNDCENTFRFRSNYNLSVFPDKIEYGTGDTITVKMDISSLLSSVDMEAEFDNSNQPFSFIFDVHKFDFGKSEAVSARDFFEFQSIRGEIDTTLNSGKFSNSFFLSTDCQMDSCNISFRMIPNDRGVFCFEMRSGNFGDRMSCQELTLSPNSFLASNNNSEVLEDFNIKGIRTPSGSFIRNVDESKTLYCFRTR